MVTIRTVVCPVDFTAATARQVDLAADVCRAFGARLVLHHNIADPSIGSGVGWMWNADHMSPALPSPDDQLRSVSDRVSTEVRVDVCITRGAATEAVLGVSEAADAGLVVLSAHSGTIEDHASVVEYLLDHSDRAILALHDPGEDVLLPTFASSDGEERQMQSILVPASRTDDPCPAVDFACDLARRFSLRLHLVHVIESGTRHPPGDEIQASTKSHLDALVPPDLVDRTLVHVDVGDPVTAIAMSARRLAVSCIVMGEHTRVPVKRWLRRDTSRAVLREAPCPVWYVPTIRARVNVSLSRFALSTEKSRLWGNV